MGVLKGFLFVIVALSLICGSVQELSSLQAEKKRLMDKLLDNYDTLIRPSGGNSTEGPVMVTVNMLLRDVTSVSDYDMDFGVQVILRQEWVDERLKFDNPANLKYLLVTDSSKIWIPDLFILNEKDSQLHKLMTSNTFFRITPAGHVLYSASAAVVEGMCVSFACDCMGISLTLWCHMNLQRYPFDTQMCSMRVASYAHTVDELKFSWKQGEPLQISSNANIMGFTIGKGGTSTCNSNTITGEYSCLRVDFSLKRDLQYYLFHIFLPTSFLVILSWTAFWLEPRASVPRILLGLGTLLASASISSDVEASVPHVPYVKAMDLWSAACFMFLLAALLESALVNSIRLPHAESKGDEGSNSVDMKPLVYLSTESPRKSAGAIEDAQTPLYRGLLSRLPRDPHVLDSTARLILPPVFLAFVVIYFSACLLL